MKRSDWSDAWRTMGASNLTRCARLAFGICGLCIIGWGLLSCVSLSTVPSGVPGCPERQHWSDSAQACRPVEGR